MSVCVSVRERHLCEEPVLLLQYVDGLRRSRRSRRSAAGAAGGERLENGTFFNQFSNNNNISE